MGSVKQPNSGLLTCCVFFFVELPYKGSSTVSHIDVDSRLSFSNSVDFIEQPHKDHSFFFKVEFKQKSLAL